MLVKITNTRSEYSENILPHFCTFDKPHTWSVISGGSNAVIANSSTRVFKGVRSLKATFTGTSQIVFSSGGTETTIKAPQTGNYIFSTRLFKTANNATVIFSIFKNGIPFLELSNNLTDFENGKWNTYAQSFALTKDDTFSFNMKLQSDTIGTELYIDGLKLELDDRNLGIPSVYSKPFDQITGWQSKTDTVGSQTLTANTDNLIAFTGVDANNGLNQLINGSAKITPLNINDAINIDFAFSFNSPSGTDDYLKVMLVVNGVVYRAQSFNILEPTGETNYVAVSFHLAVMQDFFDNGAEIYINPNVAITINNRYLQVSRTHKGV